MPAIHREYKITKLHSGCILLKPDGKRWAYSASEGTDRSIDVTIAALRSLLKTECDKEAVSEVILSTTITPS